MRAIWAALLAAARYLSKARVYLGEAYYETPLGIPLIKKLDACQLTTVKHSSEASIVMIDLNPCITRGKENVNDAIGEKNKILILDATSATAACVNNHLVRFMRSRAAILFLVDSGFKNQQMSADKNSYGTVRIFTRDKKRRDAVYQGIKKVEKPISSPVSHTFRRTMKRLGAVPVTRLFYHPSLLDAVEPHKVIKLERFP